MTYVKQTWVNGPAGGTPISAARLSYIENGLEDLTYYPAILLDAIDDGVSDNGGLMNAALEKVDTRGGGIVVTPPTTIGLKFTTGCEVPSNCAIISYGTKFINDAFITGKGNNLFHIEDASKVWLMGMFVQAVATGDFTGGRNPQKFFQLAGVVEDIYLLDWIALDHQSFTGTYGDTRTDPALAKLTNVHVRGFRISGDTGPVADGSGLNFNPRSIDINGTPGSRNLFISEGKIDVTRGQNDVNQHGPQCIKASTVRGAWLRDLDLRGGSENAIAIPDGMQDAHIAGMRTSKSYQGGNITNVVQVLGTGDTKNLTIRGWRHRSDGAVNGVGVGLRLASLQGVDADGLDLEGHIWLAHSGVSGSTSKRIRLAGTVKGNVEVRDPGSAQTPIEELDLTGLTVVGGSGSGGGRFLLDKANWPVNGLVAGRLESIEPTGHAFSLQGDDAEVGSLKVVRGNPDAAASAICFDDKGTRNDIGSLSVIGGSMTSFFRRQIAGKTRIGRLKGTVTAAAGLILTNQTSVMRGNLEAQSPEIVLSGGAVDHIIFAATEVCYLLGYEVVYTVASSADPGVAINVGNRGLATRYGTWTSDVSAAAGFKHIYANTTGTDSFSTRRLEVGDVLRVGSPGGKTGAGTIKVVAQLATVLT